MPHDTHARTGADARSTDPAGTGGPLLDGRYRVGRRIARGGMASVHEALDVRLDRPVAVKIMHPSLGDDRAFAERFVREARSAARLSHPNVVSVFDQGADGGTVFLAMELVTGHTLRDVVAHEAPLAPARALALLDPVLSALAAAHRAGLVHRDVKPENVLVADDGRIKVADFGLAKAVSTDTQHTATHGVLIGTVAYLAPELVVEGQADARADVYAAGVLLYELLTGEKPHRGETPIQVAYRHVHHDVPPPSELVPGLPAYVDALVARATARERGLRPADASVLLHQVHRVAHALAEGVAVDDELTADLMPPRAPHRGEDGGEADRIDTSPQMWDEAEMAQLLGPPPGELVRDHTTVLRDDAPPPPAPAAPARTEQPPPRRRRRGRLVLLLVLALVLAGGAYWLGWARYTAVPSVVGQSQAAAERALAQAGLDADVEPTFSENVPEGEVVDTDPGPGGRVVDGGTVTLEVSQGPERYDVPKLRGSTEDAAQDTLAETSLAFGETTEEFSEKVAEGEVIRSVPKAGTTLRPGEPVDLVVSKGREPIEVGSWVGEDVDDARAELEERGLVVRVGKEEFSDEVDEGGIIAQDPANGETLFRGDEVVFTVSKGPELVEVPSVRAMGVDAATERLEAEGFTVTVERYNEYFGLGFAASTDPGAGELAPRGSEITLFVI